jgi:hypothetical protein
MIRIYEIPQRVREYYAAIEEDGVVPEGYEGLFDNAADSILYRAGLIKEYDAEIEAIKAEIARLSEKAKAKQNTADRMKRESAEALRALGTKKVANSLFSVSYRSTFKTVLDDESAIPAEFKKVEVVETTKIDKTAIKNAIKGGAEVAGAHLEETESIMIK